MGFLWPVGSREGGWGGLWPPNNLLKLVDFVGEKGCNSQGRRNKDSDSYIFGETTRIYQKCNIFQCDRSLKRLTVKEMIDFETACMVHKALHGLAPPCVRSIFHKLSESCNRTLCNTSTDLRILLCKTSNGQQSFSYQGVTVWNQLSPEIKTAPSSCYQNEIKIFFERSKRLMIEINVSHIF